jgi:hypothetical protein
MEGGLKQSGGSGMFMHRAQLHPAIGKADELRPLLEEEVRARHAQGLRANLTRSLYSNSQWFAMGVQFESLAAREAWQSGPAPAAAPPLLRAPNQLTLLELLVAANPGGREVKYVERVTVEPVAGKGAAVRSLLSSRASRDQASENRVGLSVRVAGEAAGTFEVQFVYADLAEFEAAREKRRTDAGFAEFVDAIAPLLARRTSTEMFEVLIPFPTRE